MVKKYDATFLRFDTIPECNGQTDGHLCFGYTSACIARYANALVIKKACRAEQLLLVA